MGSTESKQSEGENSVSKRVESTQSKRRQSEVSDTDGRHIIAAIDFGTSYTGFAYAFNGRVDQIFTGIHGMLLKDDRVPTVLLLEPNGDFLSFGIDAEYDYATLVLKDRHHEYRLFRQFKMALYTQSDILNKELTINDTEGRPKKAVDIFSIIIKHLKELILESISMMCISNEILTFKRKTKWMLSIPAIWSDSARQFMREAAVQGGIPEKNLRLVLEPEAASLFCQNQLLQAVYNAELKKLPPGTKYIIADLGGGTVDICCHEILENKNIRELYRVQGGSYGGSSVNNEFIQFLIKLFGTDILKRFERDNLFDYLQIMREFEENKRKFGYDGSYIIHIPSLLIHMLERDTGSTLVELVASTTISKCVKVVRNKLICDETVMESFFKSSVEGILQKLRETVSHCRKDNIGLLLVVGGYSESRYVREMIRKEIYQLQVVIVQEPRLAVLKGAVYMGLEPRNIIERRARYTYGFAVTTPFQEGTDPENLKFIREGEVYCDDIFSKVIEKDQILTYNSEFKVSTSNTFGRPASKRLELIVALYRTDRREPQYCLETENCTRVAEIVLEPPVDGWPNYVDIDTILIMGENEFTVKAIDKSSGREYKSYVDFL